MLLEKKVGMNFSSFQLFILHWEISQFVVANKRLVFSFVMSRDGRSYIRMLRVEVFVRSYFTSRVVFCQRYTRYSKYLRFLFSFILQMDINRLFLVSASRFVCTINSMFLFQHEMRREGINERKRFRAVSIN